MGAVPAAVVDEVGSCEGAGVEEVLPSDSISEFPLKSREIYGRPCAECSKRRRRNQTDDTSGIQERGGAQETDPPKIFPEERKQITREDPQKPVTLKEKRTRKDNQSKEKVKKQGGDRGRRAEGGEKRE